MARWSNVRHSRPTGADRQPPALVDHDLFRDTVSGEDRDLRLVDDRERDPRARCTGIGDGEGAAGQIVGDEAAGASARRDVGDGAGERAEPEPVGVTDDRHHETLEVEVDRDTEVDRAVHDQRIAVDARVDERERSQGVDDRARDEREVREREAFFLTPCRAAFAAHGFDRGVVGGDDAQRVRRRLLRRDQELRGALAHVVERRDLVAERSVRSRAEHVVARHAPIRAGALHLGNIDPEVGCRPARRARHERLDGTRRASTPGQYLGSVRHLYGG